MTIRENYVLSAKTAQIRIKGQSKVLSVKGFGEVDMPYLVFEQTTHGKLDFIAVKPHRMNDKIYKSVTEIGRQDGVTKYRVQTVTPRRDGESVIMALTAFCKIDTEYLMVVDYGESSFTITEVDLEKNRDRITWEEIDEIIGACKLIK